MKIGLFTIFRCVNYGAVLQAIALKNRLMYLFPESRVDVINHFMDCRDNHLLGKVNNPNISFFQRWRNRMRCRKKFHGSAEFECRRDRTVRLIEKALSPLGVVFKHPEEFAGLSRYDVVIVGSDQVWNPVLNHDFPVNQYLCKKFPEDQRRVSYAASFGIGELPEELTDEYRAALSKFDKITVREKTGAAIVEKLLGKRPQVVLDPTMLLSADEWVSLACQLGRSVDNYVERYLFAYWVRVPLQADVDAMSKIAESKNMRIVFTVAGQLPKLKFHENVVPCLGLDPIDWVVRLACSQGVITDSFHGLQFAVNFSKPVLALAETGDSKSNASRLVDFCDRYGASKACHDLNDFRRGYECEMVSGFDLSELEASKIDSISILRRMCYEK